MGRPEAEHQLRHQLRPDGAHRPDGECRLLKLLDRARLILGGAGLFLDALQIRQHHPSKLGQMRIAALAVEQRAAELMLKLLDGARQRRLADVALLGGAREVQRLAEREKVTDLMEFHGGNRLARRDYTTNRVGHNGASSKP